MTTVVQVYICFDNAKQCFESDSAELLIIQQSPNFNFCLV